MEAACRAAGAPCPGKVADTTLFHCIPGFTNSIKKVHDCIGHLPGYDICKNGGTGKSDQCDFIRPTQTKSV
jgi:hypothetical protein